jgi:hypothetical protein
MLGLTYSDCLSSLTTCDAAQYVAQLCIHFSFRDRLHTNYRSSSKAKISRRKEEASHESSAKDFDEFMAQDPLHQPFPFRVQTSGMRQNASLEEDNRKRSSASDLFERRPSPMDNMHLSAPHPDPLDIMSAFHQDSATTMRNVDVFQQPRISGYLLGGDMDHTRISESAMIGGDFRAGAFGVDARRMGMTGATGFGTLPAAASLNAFFGDRQYSLGGPGPNIPVEDMRPLDQRLGMEPLHPSEEPNPIGMTAMAAAKGLGFPQESTWQSRQQRKLPPMPQSVFDGMFKAITTTAVGVLDLARKPTDDDIDGDLHDDDPLPL